MKGYFWFIANSYKKTVFFFNWTSLLKQFPQDVKPAGKALMEPLDLAQHNLSGI